MVLRRLCVRRCDAKASVKLAAVRSKRTTLREAEPADEDGASSKSTPSSLADLHRNEADHPERHDQPGEQIFGARV
jgi:hypothetical protein